MISHVSVCLLAHEEKGLISDTFCYPKREYSFSSHAVRIFLSSKSWMELFSSMRFNLLRVCILILT